ncbi:MAG: UDP-N-acetylmuramoyl-L-alanine--D-glutamate ligase [Actinomyces sp.]|nr:MAG: UDP-N-acetylmuramoyl-L-alanine--D-glutamate ligase [Actinomyces sp.]
MSGSPTPGGAPTPGELMVDALLDGNELAALLARRGRVLVVGYGVTNRCVARFLTARGHTVTVVDDAPGPDAAADAAAVGARFLPACAPDRLGDEVAAADLVVPTPGLPERHPVFGAARAAGRPLVSELDLAAAVDDRPVLAVTGTNAKTTLVELAAAALTAAGRRVRTAGNTSVPLVAAVTDAEPELFVVEASSFRLARTCLFSPRVAVWSNFAPDHLDVHLDLAGYRAAKSRIWRHLPDDGVAVAAATDPVVTSALPADRRVLTYRADGTRADFHREGDRLVGPDGPWAHTGELWRSVPHDVENVLGVAAAVSALGAPLGAVARAARDFPGLPHRLQRVATVGAVTFHDDSKSTTPHATLAAVRAVEGAVLVAGGRNKGLDLGALAPVADHVTAVVAMGEAADELVGVLADRVPVVVARDMDEAVATAHELARDAGVDVVLSPGCASFDAYRDYAARGDDFIRAVHELAARHTPREVGP